MPDGASGIHVEAQNVPLDPSAGLCSPDLYEMHGQAHGVPPVTTGTSRKSRHLRAEWRLVDCRIRPWWSLHCNRHRKSRCRVHHECS